MDRNWRQKIGIGMLALGIGMQAGCHQQGTSVKTAGVNAPFGAPALAPGTTAEAATPDLSKPFRISRDDSQSFLAPLNFARLLARSAGGTWIVFTQKPLDDVKWPEQNNPFGGNMPSSGTVQETLEALRKAGTPIAWAQEKSALLLDYGPPSELEQLRKQPPTETVGLFIRAATVPDMVRAVSDTWRLQIDVDPELVKQRAAYAATRQKVDAEQKQQQADQAASSLMAMMNFRRYGMNNGLTQPSEKTVPALEFKAIQRLDQNGLMQELARYLGGNARHIDGNHWEFTRLSDPKQVAVEVQRLKGVIDQATANIMAGSTSYESRMGGDTDIDASSDNAAASVPLPALSEEAVMAFDALGVLGQPAMATLTAYLDPEKPPLAAAAARTLDIMSTPEGKSALVAFVGKLRTPAKDKTAKAMLPALQADLIPRISREPDAQATRLLTDMVLDADLSPQTRTAARMALVKAGNLTPFETGGSSREMHAGEMDFVLRDPPAGSGLQPMRQEQKRNAVSPLATAKTPNGEDWAVFVSGRLGDPRDLWLAHGKDGKWSEFLFTGHVFTQSQEYGVETSPKPGACVLTVNGDRIVIRPPGKDNTAELQRLQTAMNAPKLTMQERRRVMTRYQQLSQSSANLLAKAITLSLADLRKDSDKDGLPDVVETRLGLDPHKADTDGDGLPDGQDANPLAAPDRAGSDRVRLLQMVFTALYGKDAAPDPILVILDRDKWQEFYGAGARILCITKDDYLQRSKHLGALRVLQFGGPQDEGSTILLKDGPCLFNESHTRAEVHFWQWQLPSQQGAYMMGMMSSGGLQITDYIAQFARKGEQVSDWKLVSIKPCHVDTGERALAALMQARMNAMNGMNGGDE